MDRRGTAWVVVVAIVCGLGCGSSGSGGDIAFDGGSDSSCCGSSGAGGDIAVDGGSDVAGLDADVLAVVDVAGEACPAGDAGRVGTDQWVPLVVLLMDTSASMQNALGGSGPGELPSCHSGRREGVIDGKSRWVGVLEALTGTFNDYWCSYDARDADPDAEDYVALPPHVVPHGEQAADGVLDDSAGAFAFGLLTADPDPATGTGPEGAFSFGPDKTSPYGTINLGAHNAGADWGALVVPATKLAPEALQGAADSVQAQLLGARPYAGTPVAPLLDDLLHLVQTEPVLQPFDAESQTGDPGYACRAKVAVLITDGYGPIAEGNSGYSTSPDAAASLLAAGWQVHVIALQPDESASMEFCNSIAAAGGTEAALVVADGAALRGALQEILDALQ